MQTRARIQRFHATQIGGINTRERAVLPCGCQIVVGVNSEGKVQTGAMPCKIEHEPITDRSSGILREMIKTPKPRKLLVETCRDALQVAAREMGL